MEDPGEDWSGKDQTIRSDGSRWLESTSQQTAETINGEVTWGGGGGEDTGAIGEVWVIPESQLLNVDLDVDGRWCACNKTNWFVNIYISFHTEICKIWLRLNVKLENNLWFVFKDKEKIEIARRRGSFRVKKMAFAPVEINRSNLTIIKKKKTYKNLKKLFFLYFINSNKSSFDTNYR